MGAETNAELYEKFSSDGIGANDVGVDHGAVCADCRDGLFVPEKNLPVKQRLKAKG
jgi:hypothetical protein